MAKRIAGPLSSRQYSFLREFSLAKEVQMYVAVQHRISDPEKFWGKAQELVPNLPAGMQLHHSMPTKDGTRGICIWEGESVAKVKTFLEGHLSSFSNNDYFEVENKDQIGLPSGVVGK